MTQHFLAYLRFVDLVRLLETAIRLAEVQLRHNISINTEDYIQDNLKFGLVEVVYEWAKVVELLTSSFFTLNAVIHLLYYIWLGREHLFVIFVSSLMCPKA